MIRLLQTSGGTCCFPFPGKTPRQILLTHHHEDHSGNAARLRQLTGLTPMASEDTGTIMARGFPIPLVQKYIWDNSPPAILASLADRIELADGSKLQDIPAPGHATDMVCYFAPDKGWLFSADQYISRSIRYMRDDENLSVLINSIRKVLSLDFDTIFCPHRGVLENGRQTLVDNLNNFRILFEKAQNLHQQGQSVKTISRTLQGHENSISYLTGFGFCKRNLIRECLKVDLQAIPPVT